MSSEELSLEELTAMLDESNGTPAPAPQSTKATKAPKPTESREMSLDELDAMLAEAKANAPEPEKPKEAPEPESSWRGIRDLAPNAIREVTDIAASVDFGGGSLRDQTRDAIGKPKGRRIGPTEGAASAIGAGLIGGGEAIGNAVSPYIPEAVKKGGKWAVEQFLQSTYGQSIPWAMEQAAPALEAAEKAAPDAYNTAKNVAGGLATIGTRGTPTLKRNGLKVSADHSPGPIVQGGKNAQAKLDRGTSANVDKLLERHIPKDPDKVKVGEQVSTGPMPWQARDTWDLGTQHTRAMDEVKNLPDVKPDSTAHDINRAVVKAEKKAMDDLDAVLDKHKDKLSDPDEVYYAVDNALDAWRGDKTMGMRSKHSKTIDLLKDDLDRLIGDPEKPLTPRRLREIRQEVDKLIADKDFGTDGANAQSQMGLVLRKVLNEKLDEAIPDGSARELLTRWSNLEVARPYTIKAANIEAPTKTGRLADEIGMKRAQTAAGVGSETEMFTNPGTGMVMIGVKGSWVVLREALGLRGMPLAKAKARVGKEIAEIDRILKRNPGDKTFKAKRAVLVDFLANGTKEDLEAEE